MFLRLTVDFFKMTSQKFSFSFFIVFLSGYIVFLGLMILLFLYDPFQFFHQPILRKNTFIADMRNHAAGIIDHYSFDSIIIGSSMLENTDIDEANQKLNHHFVNLSFGASHFEERWIILNYLFKKKNIKNVIYSLDSYNLVNPDYRKISIRSHLYHQNDFIRFFSRFYTYLNTHFIRCALYWQTNDGCTGERSLKNATEWFSFRQKEFGGFQNWRKDLKQEAVLSLKIYNQFNHQNKQNNYLPPPPKRNYNL